MRSKLSFYCIVCLVLVCGGHTARGQDTLNDDDLIRVKQSLIDLEVTLRARNYTPADTAKERIVEYNITRVDRLLSRTITNILNMDSVPDNLRRRLYLEIQNYGDLFRVAEQARSLDSISDLVQFVGEDLSCKFIGPLADATFSGNEFVSVRVRVFRRDTMKEIPGYLAHVKPVWSVNPLQIEDFNPTTNAVKSILPGRKLFWIEKDGTVLQKRIENIRIDVGQEIPIDFTVGN